MKQFLFVLMLFFCCVFHAQKSDFKHIDFNKADSIAHGFLNESLSNLPLLTYKLTHNLNTEVEKFRALYLWVSSNIEADYYFGEKTIRVRKKFKNDSISLMKWNREMQSKMFKRLLKEKKTICSGYAYLLKELCALANINCEIIDGYSRTVDNNVGKIGIPNHSWNAVELNKKWYLIDATLASGFFFVNENKFIKNYNDGYFLADPKLFIKSHFPLNKKWTLLKDPVNLKAYAESPLIYGKTFMHKVIPMYPKRLNNELLKGESLTFKLKVSNDVKIEDVKVVLSNGKVYKLGLHKHFVLENGVLEFEHCFSKKGTRDLHVKIKNDVVASYTIKVKHIKKEKTLS